MPIENIITYVIVILAFIIMIFYFVRSIVDIANKKSNCCSCSSKNICKKDIKKP